MKIVPFYTYYVAHIIRQYFAELQPTNPTKAYQRNQQCAGQVISQLTERQQHMLRDVYRAYGGTLTARVELAAERYHAEKTEIWNLITDTERKVAETRELI